MQRGEPVGQYEKPHQGYSPVLFYFRRLPADPCGAPPAKITPEIIGHHIISIDQHRPFTTDAAKRIVDTVEPEFLTHELFGLDFSIPVDKVTMQRNAAMGIGSGRMEKEG